MPAQTRAAMANRLLLAELHAIEQALCSHQCLAPDPGYYLLMTLFNTTIPRRRAPAFVPRLRTTLVEEARAYENNCIFAEGAPSPRLGPRVDPRPPHGAPDAFGLLPLLSLFDAVNELSICTPAKNSEIPGFLSKSTETSQKKSIKTRARDRVSIWFALTVLNV